MLKNVGIFPLLSAEDLKTNVNLIEVMNMPVLSPAEIFLLTSNPSSQGHTGFLWAGASLQTTVPSSVLHRFCFD